jgi:alpha-1,6-mannosyltransferase
VVIADAARPALLSLDAYSCLAQGEMQRLGLDPYQLGPAALGPSRALAAVDPFWQQARVPYGPLALLLARLCAATGGTVTQLVALHVVAGLSVLVLGVSLSAACPAPGGRWYWYSGWPIPWCYCSCSAPGIGRR